MEPLTAREQRKLQDEIARQEKQDRAAGQQKLLREGQLQKQQKVHAKKVVQGRLACIGFGRPLIMPSVHLQRQQEMLQYRQKHGQWLSQLETAPTFYPTFDEFQNPISYIRSIQAEGSKHGALLWSTSTDRPICKECRTNCSAMQVYAKSFPRSCRQFPVAW